MASYLAIAGCGLITLGLLAVLVCVGGAKLERLEQQPSTRRR